MPGMWRFIAVSLNASVTQIKFSFEFCTVRNSHFTSLIGDFSDL